ncbi:hypothetical protein LZ32DRAFT_375394 [Colletotrichum eremochloae]|nr:hypothetical protein LZ32DRAFT_375394 [Colletotrichum eremochloae]
MNHRTQPSADWTQDMVLLPEVSEMPGLKAILGIKGHKFDLINEAVPSLAYLFLGRSKYRLRVVVKSRVLYNNLPNTMSTLKLLSLPVMTMNSHIGQALRLLNIHPM